MRCGETPGDLRTELDDARGRQTLLAAELAQRLAADELGDHEGRAVLRADVEHGQDIGMAQCGSRTRLALKAGESIRVVGDVGRQDLDGHVAAEPGVARPVHDAHAARAERRDDVIRAEAAANERLGLARTVWRHVA